MKAAVQLIEPLKADLTVGERSTVDVRLKQAGSLCNDDKYSNGYAVTVKLARFLGHLSCGRRCLALGQRLPVGENQS